MRDELPLLPSRDLFDTEDLHGIVASRMRGKIRHRKDTNSLYLDVTADIINNDIGEVVDTVTINLLSMETNRYGVFIIHSPAINEINDAETAREEMIADLSPLMQDYREENNMATLVKINGENAYLAVIDEDVEQNHFFELAVDLCDALAIDIDVSDITMTDDLTNLLRQTQEDRVERLKTIAHEVAAININFYLIGVSNVMRDHIDQITLVAAKATLPLAQSLGMVHAAVESLSPDDLLYSSMSDSDRLIQRNLIEDGTPYDILMFALSHFNADITRLRQRMSECARLDIWPVDMEAVARSEFSHLHDARDFFGEFQSHFPLGD